MSMFWCWVLLSPPIPSFSGADEAFWHCQCDNHTHWDPLYHSPALCFWIRRKVICELTLRNLLLPRLSHDFHWQLWVWPAILHCCRDCFLRHLYASWRLHISQASFEMSKCKQHHHDYVYHDDTIPPKYFRQSGIVIPIISILSLFDDYADFDDAQGSERHSLLCDLVHVRNNWNVGGFHLDVHPWPSMPASLWSNQVCHFVFLWSKLIVHALPS